MHRFGKQNVGRLMMVAMSLSVAMAALVSCGSDDNIQRREVSELTIEGASTGRIDLEAGAREDLNQEQSPNVVLRNSGKATLNITRLELVNAPTRLQAWSATETSCETDADCGATQACLVTTCVDLGLPETPLEITPGLREDIEFLLTAGPAEIDCPDAPATVAPEFADFYCGELIIETNAINDAGIVEAGQARIMFLKPDTSGQILVTPNPIIFENIQPGSTAAIDFSIQNVGASTLEVDNISITTRANFFTISGAENTPTEIEPNQSKTWTLTVDIPTGTDPAEFVGFTELLVNSSASNASGGRVPVEVSGEAAAAANIELSAPTLKFDASPSQVLTITNTGDATLIVNRLQVDPLEARDFYSFEIDGQDVTDTLPQQNIPKGESIDVTILFERPGGNMDSSVGILTIGHNVRTQNLRSEVTLLGDAGDVPIARVYPQGFTFLAEDGNNETRTFVLRNIGTAALDVSAVSLMFSTGTDAEFQVAGIPANIPPGELATGTVSFTGMNALVDVGNAVLTTNDDAGTINLGIKDITSTGEAIIPAVTPLFSNDARAGIEASFTAVDSAPAGSSAGAIWTLADRPSGSEVFFFTTGEELRFVPDVPGTYTIALTINASQREAQVLYDLTVVE